MSITVADLVGALTAGGAAPGARLALPAGAVDAGAVVISSATHDSRRVRPGALFCCVVGSSSDGHLFAQQAVDAGAAALLVQREVTTRPGVPQIVVADSRAAMGPAASAVHGNPSGRLVMVGITGTNGKTSTAHLLAAVLERAGRRVAVIGTLTQARTTPEATDLQEQLAGLVDQGITDVVMEVSSHALVLHRVDGVRFRVVAFTNLSQDHLDFHGNMEAYFRAKALLFTAQRADEAVVNADDPHGRLLFDAAQIPTTPFHPSQADDVQIGVRSSFTWQGNRVHLRLGGAFSVANALGAAVIASRLGIAPDVVAAGLGTADVPGRFEPVDVGQPFTVIVDYAHTPDALQRVMEAARTVTPSDRRLTLVFGCGGDRDRDKRPKMGAIAAATADVAILTSDNPRSEDPDAIIAEVKGGAPEGTLVVVPDRREAIATALRAATAGDVVVLAGKGHESGQESHGVVEPFDDRQVAAQLLREMGVGR